MTAREYAQENGCSLEAARKRLQRMSRPGQKDGKEGDKPDPDVQGVDISAAVVSRVDKPPLRVVTVAPPVEPRTIDNQPARSGKNIPALPTLEETEAREARIAARRAKSKVWQDEEAKRTREYGPLVETGEMFTLQSGEVIRIRRRVKAGGD